MDKRIYLLGPCSAESREQVLLTASQIKETCGEMPFIYRAGVWKPRTSPRTFQGAGEQALEWLREVKALFKIAVATEIGNGEHAVAALESGIDYLWIGARTSANPMAVKEIADCIRLYVTDHPSHCLKWIGVKNPVNDDAALWLGNLERMEQTGIPVMAIHRGCDHHPCWRMAHVVRKARPDIPMLLDPSHMSGEAARVAELMEKVSALGLNGAMIEVHCDPEHALSDAKQQIRPTGVANEQYPNLSRLCLVSLKSKASDQEELEWLRAEIDELDDRIWDTIAARMEVSERIGAWKKAHGMAALQQGRYDQIINKRKQWAQEKGLDAEMVVRIFDSIHEQSLKKQE